MNSVIYIKESHCNDAKEFAKVIAKYLNDGYRMESFNTYGSGDSYMGHSVALMVKIEKKLMED